MAVHSLKTIQKFPVSLQEAWSFFSRPDNLQTITPQHLGFKVLSHHHGPDMYAGQIIEYTIRPVLAIPLYWMTEITHVQPLEYFVDEQRYGPYSMWHHQHHFKVIAGGIEMTDIVHYKLPLGVLGEWGNSLFVKDQLRTIFSYRFTRAEEIFGKWPGQENSVVFY